MPLSSVGHANEYAAPRGPSIDALLTPIGAVFDRFVVKAAAVTAYDRSFDTDARRRRSQRPVARGAKKSN